MSFPEGAQHGTEAARARSAVTKRNLAGLSLGLQGSRFLHGRMWTLPPGARALACALCLVIAPWAIAPSALAQGQPPVPVTTEPATVGAVPVEVLANGLAIAESVVTIRPRVDGQIQEVHVGEGQIVARGQLLFTLDSRLNQALLAQQEAQLAALRAQAERFRADAVRYQSLRGRASRRSSASSRRARRPPPRPPRCAPPRR